MEQEKALVVPTVTELKIPTTKLNFMQEKKYREWGFKTLEEIESLALEVENEERNRYIDENKEKIIAETVQKHKKFAAIHQFVLGKRVEMRQLEAITKRNLEKLQFNMDQIGGQMEKAIVNMRRKVKAKHSEVFSE